MPSRIFKIHLSKSLLLQGALSAMLTVLFLCENINAGDSKLFEKGIQSYQQKNYVEALTIFRQARDEDPQREEIWYNLGLAAFQAGGYGEAAAALRKSLDLDPWNSSARKTLALVFQKIPDRSTSADFSTNLRHAILQYITIEHSAALLLFTLFFSLWIWLGYLGRRKTAKRLSIDFPSLPRWGIALSFFAVLSFMLFGLKVYDSSLAHATIIEKSLDVRAGPSTESASLFSVFEGQEVELQIIKEDWAFVNVQGGLTGWVPQKSLVQSSGRNLW